MTLKELFERLSFGELSNLYEGDEGSGVIQDDAKPKIVRFANDALLRLYTRFVLKEKDLLLELRDHITNYQLLGKFAESRWETSGQDYLYIKDLMREPFEDDVIRILSVYDNFDNQLPINNETDPNSVFTPQGNVLQVPRPLTGITLGVTYQARHATLDWEQEDQEIEVPLVLEEAFLSYIAYKTYKSKNTQEAQGIAQEHLSLYEAICQDVIDKDLVSNSVSQTNVRFDLRGWK